MEITGDGKRLLIAVRSDAGRLGTNIPETPITIVVNWLADLTTNRK